MLLFMMKVRPFFTLFTIDDNQTHKYTTYPFLWEKLISSRRYPPSDQCFGADMVYKKYLIFGNYCS
jgi:hypothetical protein